MCCVQGPDYLNIGRGKPVANFDAACERNGSWGAMLEP